MPNPKAPPAQSDSIPQPLLNSARQIAQWAAGMDLAHEFLMAGLRHQVGPQGDVVAAYKEWYAREMEEHDQMMRQMAANLYRRGVRHGR